MISERRLVQIGHPKEILLKAKILQMFWDIFYGSKSFQSPYSFLVKRGEDRFNGLEGVVLFPSDKSEIARVDCADFAKQALREIERYRLVGRGIYEICDGNFITDVIIDPGEYLIDSNGKPSFRVLVSKIEGYIFNSVEIKPFNDGSFLRYVPQNEKEPEDCPNEIRIEVALSEQDNILFNTYKRIMEHHKKRTGGH